MNLGKLCIICGVMTVGTAGCVEESETHRGGMPGSPMFSNSREVTVDELDRSQSVPLRENQANPLAPPAGPR